MTGFEHLMWLKDVNQPEVYFILRLHIYGTIGWEDKDISLAHFYGIPDCCRNLFVMLYKRRLPPALYMWKKFGKDSETEYVRCLKCRKGVKT